MKSKINEKILLLIVKIFFASIPLYSQTVIFPPEYHFEGYIETNEGRKLEINLNISIFKDSLINGSYHYNPHNGSLALSGYFKNKDTFYLIEKDSSDRITGSFKGSFINNREIANGIWVSPDSSKHFKFHLNQLQRKSHWYYITKNRDLPEYNNLHLAIKDNEKVLSIDVAKQDLKKLPKKIGELPNLVSINLLGNEFQTFPKVLFQLKQIEEISLSSNRLSEIGKEIGNLKKLRILILNNNQLKTLPNEIGELRNLLYLELGNNQLSVLPSSIKDLSLLQELHLERNKFNEGEKQRIRNELPSCNVHF